MTQETVLIDVPNYTAIISHYIESNGQCWNILTKVFEDGSVVTTKTKGLKILFGDAL